MNTITTGEAVDLIEAMINPQSIDLGMQSIHRGVHPVHGETFVVLAAQGLCGVYCENNTL